jgi:outer membrane protein insertion porin family
LPDSADFLNSEGDLKEYGLKISYDSRDDKRSPSRGLLSALTFLNTSDTDSADFDYSVAHFEFKGYIPIARSQTVMLRLRTGQSDDYLPLFRRFFIGGIGSLRGYDYKEFEGNRYTLFNVDYIWTFRRSDFGAGVFFDAGKAAYGQDAFESAEIKTDVGICLLITDILRVDLAQRLDDLDRSPVASFRFDILF